MALYALYRTTQKDIKLNAVGGVFFDINLMHYLPRFHKIAASAWHYIYMYVLQK